MATNTSILGLSKPAYTDDADVAVINSNSDLIDAEAGRTRANFAAEYSTSSAYAVGAFCTHAGILYQCNTAIGSGGEAWTAAHWTQISAGDAIVANNQAIATLNNNLTDYVKIIEASIGATGTIAAKGSVLLENKSVSSYIPTGYKLIGAFGRYPGDPAFCFIQTAISGSNVSARIGNYTDSANSGTASVWLICIRS